MTDPSNHPSLASLLKKAWQYATAICTCNILIVQPDIGSVAKPTARQSSLRWRSKLSRDNALPASESASNKATNTSYRSPALKFDWKCVCREIKPKNIQTAANLEN